MFGPESRPRSRTDGCSRADSHFRKRGKTCDRSAASPVASGPSRGRVRWRRRRSSMAQDRGAGPPPGGPDAARLMLETGLRLRVVACRDDAETAAGLLAGGRLVGGRLLLHVDAPLDVERGADAGRAVGAGRGGGGGGDDGADRLRAGCVVTRRLVRGACGWILLVPHSSTSSQKKETGSLATPA